MSRVRRVGVAVAVVALVGAGVAVALVRGADDVLPQPAPSPSASAEADLTSVAVARASFCDAIDEDDVSRALDGPVASSSSYDSGQRAVLASGVRDVAHEFSCTYRAASGAEARAWVFAEPVRPGVARRLAREARSATGCRALPDAPAFGSPSVATTCRTGRPPRTQVALRGLFGDAWLSCQLSAPAAAGSPLADRAERWCTTVATTLAVD